MKKLRNLIAGAGVLLIIYSLVARFVSDPTIGLGLIVTEAKSGLILGNSLLLISIVIKFWNKE